MWLYSPSIRTVEENRTGKIWCYFAFYLFICPTFVERRKRETERGKKAKKKANRSETKIYGKEQHKKKETMSILFHTLVHQNENVTNNTFQYRQYSRFLHWFFPVCLLFTLFHSLSLSLGLSRLQMKCPYVKYCVCDYFSNSFYFFFVLIRFISKLTYIQPALLGFCCPVCFTTIDRERAAKTTEKKTVFCFIKPFD